MKTDLDADPVTSEWRDPRTIGAFALASAVLVGVSAAIAWRLGYSPDWSSHHGMVEHHAHHLSWRAPGPFERGEAVGHSYYLFSPLPYLPYLPFQWLQESVDWAGGSERPNLTMVRFGGLTIALAQFVLTIDIVRHMYRSITARGAIGVAFVVNLLPHLRFLHGYVNADAVSVLLATACASLGLRLLDRRTIRLRDALAVGVVLGLVAHSRYYAFVAAAALALLFLFRLVRQGGPVRDRLRMGAFAFALVVLLAGSFHLRTYETLQTGDILGATANDQVFRSSYSGVVPPPPPFGDLLERRLRETPGTLIQGFVDYPRQAELGKQWFFLLIPPFAVGLLALLHPVSRRTLTPAGRVLGIAAGLGVLVTLAIMLEPSTNFTGRYLVGATALALPASIGGATALLDRGRLRGRALLVVSGAWGILLLGFDLWGIAQIA